MHKSIHRCQNGNLVYYICDRLPMRHAFTTKAGGVSRGDCESLNLGFNRGDDPDAVRRNYALLTEALGVPAERLTMTHQVHEDRVEIVTDRTAGTGLARPLNWNVDALVTALPDTPLIGYYADCVVTLFYDPTARVCGVCHAGWRGTAAGLPAKTARVMVHELGACAETMVAVIGPSICQDCFETDADVPDAMRARMGASVDRFIDRRGEKFHVDLQGIHEMELAESGLRPENIINSGICTRCAQDEFWSHRATHGRRGVQGALICL